MTGAEGRGDRPIGRRSRFTLACARAEPLAPFALMADGVVRFHTGQVSSLEAGSDPADLTSQLCRPCV